MAQPARILIPGGYGVFGRLLVRELLDRTPAHLIVAGRRLARAAALCDAFQRPGRLEPLELDVSDPAGLARAARGCLAVVGAAGPFQGLPPGLVEGAVQAGAHWLDLADDRQWVCRLLADDALDAAARAAGVAVMPGLSTVPALSAVLVRWCRQDLPHADRGRITLAIGNRNAKGTAVIASVLGSAFDAPQPVELPLGPAARTSRRLAYRVESPDAPLLQRELGMAVEFRVALEWPAAALFLAALAPLGRRLSPKGREALGRCLSYLSRPLNRFGSDLGCLQAEVWHSRGGHRVTAACFSHGQRLAVLPCALTLEATLRGELHPQGVLSPGASFPALEWAARLEARGVRFSPPRQAPPAAAVPDRRRSRWPRSG
ncbi:MAG TPA: NAD(P)H-binding protein [Chloroflexota bacterium]|jgi:hypothetical protein|nr:NAD(P)H-binding protein [Chloroflexota bacterium]